jgi:serine/threonine protein kinase
VPEDDDPRSDGHAERPQDEIATRAISPTDPSILSVGVAIEENERPTFQPGEIVAERYRVIRFIAEGGMGEVYEAEDLTLRGRIALKTIRPEIARNPTALERFKREINVARRITHPNVSRVYDVGVHRGEIGGGGLPFLTW